MTQTEFLDLLRYYFRRSDPKMVNEILADYEAHFEEGKKRGLSEEEIAKELGSPKTIYASYAEEGMVDEAKVLPLKENAEKAATAAAKKVESTWKELSPKIPSAAEHAALVTAYLLYGAGILVALILIAATILVLTLLSIEFTPLSGVAPLPGLHPLTMVSIGAAGFFSALSILFIGLEGSKAIKASVQKSPTETMPKKGGDEA